MVMIFLMKKIRKLITIFCVFIFYCYFVNIDCFPNKILLYQDSQVNYRLCPFLSLKGDTSTSFSGKSAVYHVSLSLGDIALKDVELKRAERIEVVACR